ncbi:protein O-linked-mannose beta-1,2-N-acetylglucosaminyltransferase 1-like isoform X2 [Penaeus chinensis]|uniref:protein O-linked-mannose beta-1,2-N-acetylglucosaminyltransferase 1-like isoform X2 n=1 Tax=Penaeus chinensis TaxID=139456 RepID=UPI001FB7F995|nr:protein O-linked-mannose beta-1,2-N-acetylglucosaminyltransferase 1-like isoform X2 [Penaeus chinensis]
MQQTSAILDTDTTVYGVSAYAHYSYNHTARDATRLNRVHSFPAYGWMVKRKFVEETLPKWPPHFVAADWDYWMGTGLVRRGRELIIPEISRTVHAGLTGAHVNGFLTKRRFSNKPITTDPNTRVNITGLRKEIYEREILALVNKAELLNITDPYDYAFPRTPGKVYAVFIKMTKEEDDAALKIIADALYVWNQDARDHHFGLWRIPYYDATILIIGYPYSKYRKYYKKGYNVIWANSASLEHLSDNFNDDNFFYKRHSKSDYINIMNLFGTPKAKKVFRKIGNKRTLTNQEFLTTSSQLQNTLKLHPVTEMQKNLKNQDKETIPIKNGSRNESESTMIQDSRTSASIHVTERINLE